MVHVPWWNIGHSIAAASPHRWLLPCGQSTKSSTSAGNSNSLLWRLGLATAFLVAATDVARYGVLMIVAGVGAEWGHAFVRIGHIIAGDNPAADLVVPTLMLLFGAILVVAGAERRYAR